MSERTVPIRLVIADDQALVRAGLRQLLEDHDDIDVVSEARDGATAVAAVVAHRPDVVLMDLRMPGMDGIEATRAITAADVATRVLVLTTFDTDGLVIDAVRAGASGYVLKGIEPDDLADAIRTVAAGDSLVSPAVTRVLLDAVARTSPPDPHSAALIERLTARERAIVADVAQGRSNAEIARLRHLSVATVRTHVGRAMLKVGARDRAQLVVIAHRSGLDSGVDQHPSSG
jgi:DNA-binding NarL/FixJ family response regulator